MILRKLTVGLLFAGIALGGCSSSRKLNNKEKGVLIGTGSGAAVGGVIGEIAGDNPALGAVIGAVVGGVAGGVIGNRMDKQAKKIEKSVPGAEVKRVGEGIVVEFDEKILFKTGSADLSTNAYTSMQNLVNVLNEYDETDLKVYGYTDNVGAESFNQDLSEKRAQSVANYLSSHGLNQSRIITKGYGENFPKCTNETPEGKACNRRVEFAITANEKMKMDAKNGK